MTERRNEARSLAQGVIRITLAGSTMQCEVRNLSASGCMIRCRSLLADVGMPVEVMLLPDYAAQGEIAWQLGESIGVFFLEPIHPAIVRHFALDDWMLRSDWAAGSLNLAKGL